MSNTHKDRSKRRGHKSVRLYSEHIKTTATGRRKQGNHSYVCPCCMKMSCNKFKQASRRLLRRVAKQEALFIYINQGDI